jgi:hypothetical protein
MIEKASEIIKNLKSLTSYQNTRQEALMRFFYMYGHSSIHSDQDTWMGYLGDSGIRLNIVQSACDTLVSKLMKNSPRPMFLTDGADWSARKRAEKRTRFILGAFHATKTYQKTPQALLQALVYGDGFVKVYSRNGELCVEPALTLELFVDENEALYGKPRRMWQLRLVDKGTLKAMYPEKSSIIEDAKGVQAPFYMNSGSEHNLVPVVEYWRIGKKGKKHYEGGEHRIIVGNQDLVSPQEWRRSSFPFARIGFIRNLTGYYHKGVAETIMMHQIEVNKTLKRISDNLRLVATPKVLYDYNSKLVKSHVNNDVGAMIGYLGTPPQFINPQAVSPELFKHLADMVQMAYNEVGVSTLSVTSQKPAGLNSGKALREYNDLETERFASLAKGWEQLHMDIAELILEECEDLERQGVKLDFMAPGKKTCDPISFKDVKLDKYIIQVYPTSMLPKTPAGRLEYVQEMLGAGLLSAEEGLSLLEFPDTEKITRFKNSKFNDILATIDHMLDNDEYTPPEPFQDLVNGINYMQSAYLYYRREGCPQEKLDLLLRWIQDAMVILNPEPQEVEEPMLLPGDMPMDDALMTDEMAMNSDGVAMAEQEMAAQETLNPSESTV